MQTPHALHFRPADILAAFSHDDDHPGAPPGEVGRSWLAVPVARLVEAILAKTVVEARVVPHRNDVDRDPTWPSTYPVRTSPSPIDLRRYDDGGPRPRPTIISHFAFPPPPAKGADSALTTS